MGSAGTTDPTSIPSWAGSEASRPDQPHFGASWGRYKLLQASGHSKWLPNLLIAPLGALEGDLSLSGRGRHTFLMLLGWRSALWNLWCQVNVFIAVPVWQSLPFLRPQRTSRLSLQEKRLKCPELWCWTSNGTRCLLSVQILACFLFVAGVKLLAEDNHLSWFACPFLFQKYKETRLSWANNALSISVFSSAEEAVTWNKCCKDEVGHSLSSLQRSSAHYITEENVKTWYSEITKSDFHLPFLFQKRKACYLFQLKYWFKLNGQEVQEEPGLTWGFAAMDFLQAGYLWHCLPRLPHVVFRPRCTKMFALCF